ncbi:MAG: hypothetical protein HOA58_16235 [Rhodospirillaceae bacterium]|nr:hypothetical protein [Rhodospirillaceae bacterium]MBT6831066.1 hypothetical protein [Rhodospirillaceae bacterium]MBT7291393.1 hypothetical protein [Rhodospirillaceae bacterium]
MTITPSKVFFAAIFVAYPVMVYFGLMFFDARSVAVLLILLVGARLVFARRIAGTRAFRPQLIFALAAAGAIGFLVVVSDSPVFLRFYPVCISALMLVLFFVSLLHPPTIVERFARIQNPNLPEAAVRYTRKVTIVWCVFFVCNGCAALYTALFSSLETWTLYNGAISYALMGILFAGEYLIRRRLQHRALA